jgi:hypothetical protein
VFFGCAFIVRERDHVTFDIFYLAAGGIAAGAGADLGRRHRHRHDLVVSADLGLHRLDAMRAPSTVENPFTGDQIPMRTIFIVYAIFMARAHPRYGWRFIVTCCATARPTMTT